MESTKVISNVIRFVVCTYDFTITEMKLKRLFLADSYLSPRESFLQWVEEGDGTMKGHYKKVNYSNEVFEDLDTATSFLRTEMIRSQEYARKSAEDDLARSNKDMTIKLLD